jgi:hypothetical protein
MSNPSSSYLAPQSGAAPANSAETVLILTETDEVAQAFLRAVMKYEGRVRIRRGNYQLKLIIIDSMRYNIIL